MGVSKKKPANKQKPANIEGALCIALAYIDICDMT
jgi:hypothetical protein